jgi:Ca2+-transporting ATPase
VPGRARFRIEGLRRSPDAATVLEARIGTLDGIRSVRASAVTGNVLVLFDPARWSVRAIAADIARQARAPREGREAVTAPGAAVAWHAATAAAALARCATDSATGLSSEQAAQRLDRFGANALPVPRRKSTLEILRDHLGSTPVLLLGGAAALSLATGALIDAAVILTVVGLNAAIGYVTERRVERILTSLQRVGVPQALVRRDGRTALVRATTLVPGDIVVLRAGDDVSADLRVLAADGLGIDESSLTGESVPVLKSAHAPCDQAAALGDRLTMVYAGTSVVEGSGVGVVVETGARTELGQVRTLVAESATPSTPLERQLDVMGRKLVGVSLGFCGAALALGILRGMPGLEMIRIAVSLAVAAVPEGLPAVATTTLALGTQRLLKQRTLVRRLAAVEALGAVTVICADKTGTITENRMAVAGWHLAGQDYPPPGSGADVDGVLGRALTIGVLCNDAELDPVNGEVHGSSTEGALLLAAREAGIDARALRARYPLLGSRPRLDGDHWMGTTHADGARRLTLVKGAPESVLARSTAWLDGAIEQPLDARVAARIAGHGARVAARGLRVLGLAYRTLDATGEPSYDGLVWVGLVAMTDPVRPGAREAIAACRHAGIRTVILTGDHPATAAAVGRELGLGQSGAVRVVEAAALAGLDEGALTRLVLDADVFARVSPADKHQIVRALQASGAVVAMTGDGINDAAALRAADIGVAMGAGGADVARDVADVVLLDDDFAGFVHAVEQGRTIHGNIGKSLRFLLSTNFSEILVTLAALAAGRGAPLSPVQLLWINLLSDVLPALALAVEPPEPDVMAQPPRDPAQPLLPPQTLGAIAGDAAVLSAATLGVHAIALARGGPRVGTMAFSALTAAQLGNALTLRTRGGRPGILLGVVGGSVALHVLAMTAPPLRRLLGTSPLSWSDWGVVAAGAAAPAMTAVARRGVAPPRSARKTEGTSRPLHGTGVPS